MPYSIFLFLPTLHRMGLFGPHQPVTPEIPTSGFILFLRLFQKLCGGGGATYVCVSQCPQRSGEGIRSLRSELGSSGRAVRTLAAESSLQPRVFNLKASKDMDIVTGWNYFIIKKNNMEVIKF